MPPSAPPPEPRQQTPRERRRGERTPSTRRRTHAPLARPKGGVVSSRAPPCLSLCNDEQSAAVTFRRSRVPRPRLRGATATHARDTPRARRHSFTSLGHLSGNNNPLVSSPLSPPSRPPIPTSNPPPRPPPPPLRDLERLPRPQGRSRIMPTSWPGLGAGTRGHSPPVARLPTLGLDGLTSGTRGGEGRAGEWGGGILLFPTGEDLTTKEASSPPRPLRSLEEEARRRRTSFVLRRPRERRPGVSEAEAGVSVRRGRRGRRERNGRGREPRHAPSEIPSDTWRGRSTCRVLPRPRAAPSPEGDASAS